MEKSVAKKVSEKVSKSVAATKAAKVTKSKTTEEVKVGGVSATKKVKAAQPPAEPEVTTEAEAPEEINEQFTAPVLRRLSADKLADIKVLKGILAEQTEGRVSAPSKATAEELQALIEGDYKVELADANPFAQTSSEMTEVNVSQVAICPLNPRHHLDYFDENLLASIHKSGGLIKTITVTPAKEVDPKAKVDYFVVAGNRSFTNFVEWTKSNGDKDAKLGVVVRHYDAPTHIERQAQLLNELEADNERAMSFTPIDRLKLVNAKLSLGRSKSSIARERGWSPAYVTQLTSLNNLPEKLQSYVHFKHRADLLSRSAVSELNKAVVPHTVGTDGRVEIHGISYNNAQTLASLYPSRRDFETTEEFEAEESRVLAVYNDEEVIDAAMNETDNSFKIFIMKYRPLAKQTKQVEGRQITKPSSGPEEPTGEDLEGELERELQELAEQGADKTKSKKEIHPLVKMLLTTPEKLSKELRKKEPKIDFTADALKILANRIDENDSKGIACLRYLIEAGAFDEVVDLP